jgi:hypothetical protein
MTGGPAVTIVDEGGWPVTNTTSPMAVPFTPVDAGGVPITLVDAGGYPVTLINEDGSLWSESGGDTAGEPIGLLLILTKAA